MHHIKERYALHMVFRLLWGKEDKMPEKSLYDFQSEPDYRLTVSEYWARITRGLNEE